MELEKGHALFNKLIKPIFATLRQMGYTSTNFTDDTLISLSSLEGCHESIHSAVEVLKKWDSGSMKINLF